MFRRQVASALRWTERRAEGWCIGFSEALNAVIRNDVYPDEHGERVESSERSSPLG
jgi:hypothetical protein